MASLKFCLVAGLLSVLSCAAAAEEPAGQIGRYQIVISPLAAKFTFLIDTVTGQHGSLLSILTSMATLSCGGLGSIQRPLWRK